MQAAHKVASRSVLDRSAQLDETIKKMSGCVTAAITMLS